MKRLIIFAILIFVSVGLFAQDRTVERTLSANQTLYDYSGQDADTLGTTVDTMAFVFNVNKNRPVLHNIEFKSDVVAAIDGTYTIDVKLQGRTFTSDSWSDIGTNTGQDATSAITLDFTTDLSEVVDTLASTNHPFYRQFRILVANNTVSGLDAGEQHKIEYIYLKFYER